MLTDSAKCGMKTPSSWLRTLRSTIREYENVAKNAPKVTWLPRSCVKLRNNLGPI